MNLILTMAGKYSRFIKAGYIFPKYLLPWGDKSILSEIILQLSKTNGFDKIFLIANEADDIYMNHVRKIMATYNITPTNLILIKDTVGQAESAYLGLVKIQKKQELSGPIVVHNIDTILYNRNIKHINNTLLQQTCGYIDIFKSSNHDYSYVLAKNNIILEISEKILISDQATSGLYGFSSASLFIDNYCNEAYISEIYKKLLINNINIYCGTQHSDIDTIVLGSPSEYLNQSKLI